MILKKLLFSFLILSSNCIASNCIASTSPQVNSLLKEIEASRTVKHDQILQIIRSHLPLTEQEDKGFWPLYTNYNNEMKMLNDSLLKIITQYAEEYRTGNVSKKNELDKIKKSFDIESTRIKIKRKYIEKFKAVLPSNKVALFFHIDNKIEILLRYGLSKEIPLVPVK